MAVIKTNNPFELELIKMLAFVEQQKKDVNFLMSAHATLPTKDKVLLLRKIQKDFKTSESFLEKAKKEKNLKVAISFKLENLKNKVLSLKNLWRKVEEKL